MSSYIQNCIKNKFTYIILHVYWCVWILTIHINIYKFVLIYDWQIGKFQKRASPLSPGTLEWVRLVPNNWDTDACDLRHLLIPFCFYTRTTSEIRDLYESISIWVIPIRYFWSVFGWYFLVFTKPIPEENLVGTFWYYFFGGNPFFPRKGGHGPLLRGPSPILRKKGFPAKPNSLTAMV